MIGSDPHNGWYVALIDVVGCCFGDGSLCVIEEPGDNVSSSKVFWYSKNLAVVQYCICFGFSGIQYIITAFVEVVPR